MSQICLSIFIGLVAVVSFALYDLGFLIEPHHFRNSDSECKVLLTAVGGLPLRGPEDMYITKDGLVFISSAHRIWQDKYVFHTEKDTFSLPEFENGAIFVYVLGQPDRPPYALNIVGWPKDEVFHPHGLDVLEEDDGSLLLYVVVHSQKCDSVAVFDVLKVGGQFSELRLKHRVKNSGFTCLNDVIAVRVKDFLPSSAHSLAAKSASNEQQPKADADSQLDKSVSNSSSSPKLHAFWLTNFLQSELGGLGMAYELLTRQHLGGVFFCSLNASADTFGCEQILREQLGANGISLSNDQRKLYVAFASEHKVGVFDVEHALVNGVVRASTTVQPSVVIQLGKSALDNIAIDSSDGALYLGVELSPWVFIRHRYIEGDAPSLALRIRFPDAKNASKYEIAELLSDDGKKISAASVAVHKFIGGKHHLLMGGVYRTGVLHCTYDRI